MTLLQDLQSLDLAEILNARASITVSVNTPDLQSVLSGDISVTGLGELGTALQTLQATLHDPQALFQALLNELAPFASALQVGDLALGDYATAVEQGAAIAARLLQDLDGTPESLLRVLGLSADELLSNFQSTLTDFGRVTLDSASSLKPLFRTADAGLPNSPTDLANFAVQILLPFPTASLTTLRTGLTRILDGVSVIQIPESRTTGLILALDAVKTAAAGDDSIRLQAALRELERARAMTLTSLQSDLQRAQSQISNLRLDRVLAPMADAARTLRTGQEGLIEFMETWRLHMLSARQAIESGASEDILAIIPGLMQTLDTMEATARAEIAQQVDDKVTELVAWVRSLLRPLPLRGFRAQLQQRFQEAATAIREADLDRFAQEPRNLLLEVRRLLQSADLGDGLRSQLQGVATTIQNALNTITSAIQTIRTAVDGLATQAASILDQAANVLSEFKGVIDEVKTALDQLGIDQVTQQIVDAIVELREKAQDLLSGVSLPEPLRPLVQQLIDLVAELDLDELITEPVMAKVRQFQLPESVRQDILNVLDEINRTIENLIPADLIQSIEAEIQSALDTLRRFQPSVLLNEITRFVDQAIATVAQLDPQPLINEIRAPFQTVLDAVDASHPRRLLAPVVQAYDSLLGSLPLPEPEATTQSTANFFNQQGETLGQEAFEPVQQLSDQPIETTEPGTIATTPPSFETDRPGDVVRALAYLPQRLQETIAGLESGLAQTVLQTIHSLCGGLAEDLRQIQAGLWDVETRVEAQLETLLAPLAIAELNTRFALEGSTTLGPIELEGALDVVAMVSPSALRADLWASLTSVQQQTRSAIALLSGPLGGALEGAASALENSRLAQVGTDLDAFLAALDPEPIAQELDALVIAATRVVPDLISEFSEAFQQLKQRLQNLVRDYNPVRQAQKFLRVIEVVREELDVLNPKGLVEDLSEVHSAVREAIATYDPALLVPEIQALIQDIADELQSLNPVTLLGDLSFLDDALAQIDQAVPSDALADVGTALTTVGHRLAEINPRELLEAVENIGPRTIEQLGQAVTAIQRELIALLEALQYVSANANASVSVSTGG